MSSYERSFLFSEKACSRGMIDSRAACPCATCELVGPHLWRLARQVTCVGFGVRNNDVWSTPMLDPYMITLGKGCVILTKKKQMKAFIPYLQI